MPLGSAVKLAAVTATVDRISRPAQIPAIWNTIIDAGGLDSADAGTITDPNTEITDADRHIGKVGKLGTTLRLRLQYDDGVSSITTDAIIKVFGRTGTEPWQILTNRAGNISVTMTITFASDVSDGTNNWTTVLPNDHAWDLDGCDEILVGVETILNTDANDALALLQAKVI